MALRRSQEPPRNWQAAALNNLGSVMSAQGRWKEAEERIREAISIWERLAGPDDPSVAAGLLNLGVLLEASSMTKRLLLSPAPEGSTRKRFPRIIPVSPWT
ncbi:MAG: tetratricopeptide repeat protein [Acidobacteriia bacterium]|nr:tetratricopeptide repeat protein [Terriglobia bacterium]